MNKEPAFILGAVGTAVASVMALLIAFGLDLTQDQQLAILRVIAGVGPLVLGLVIRLKVWAPANVVVAEVDGSFVAGPALPGIVDGKPVEVTPAL
jgi:hypothetical protein